MRILATVFGLIIVPSAVYLASSRPLGELIGFTRAVSDMAVDGALDGIPDQVRDKKLDNDLRRRRRELTEHEVGLSLARRDIENLEREVAELEARLARRERLLAEAAPILESSLASGAALVDFAGESRAISEFEAELDDLLDEHERETRQLELRYEGLAKFRRSVAEGGEALAQMRGGLVGLEQEIELLRFGRTQAQREGQALGLLEAVQSAPSSADSGLAKDVQALRDEVDRMEATNESRQAGLPQVRRATGIAADWERLERLKGLVAGSASGSDDSGASAAALARTETANKPAQ